MPSSTTGAEGTKEETQEDMSCSESPQVSSNKETESVSCKDESMDVCPLDSTTSPGASEIKVGIPFLVTTVETEHYLVQILFCYESFVTTLSILDKALLTEDC